MPQKVIGGSGWRPLLLFGSGRTNNLNLQTTIRRTQASHIHPRLIFQLLGCIACGKHNAKGQFEAFWLAWPLLDDLIGLPSIDRISFLI